MAIQTEWEDPLLEFAARSLLSMSQTPRIVAPPQRAEFDALLSEVRAMGQGEVSLYFTQGPPTVSVIQRPIRQGASTYRSSCIITESHFEILNDWMAWSAPVDNDRSVELSAASLGLRTMSPFLAQRGLNDDAVRTLVLAEVAMSTGTHLDATALASLGKVTSLVFPVAHELGHHALRQCLPPGVRGQLHLVLEDVLRNLTVNLGDPLEDASVLHALTLRRDSILEESGADYLALYLMQKILKRVSHDGSVDALGMIGQVALVIQCLGVIENHRSTAGRIAKYGWDADSILAHSDTIYMENQIRCRVLIEMAKIHVMNMGLAERMDDLDQLYVEAVERFQHAYWSMGEIICALLSDPSRHVTLDLEVPLQRWLDNMRPYLDLNKCGPRLERLIDWRVLDQEHRGKLHDFLGFRELKSEQALNSEAGLLTHLKPASNQWPQTPR